MRQHRILFILLFILILCQVSTLSFSQLGVPLTITKPKEYEDRVLRSEKSEDKKFSLPNRFIQNTVTHYNYYFNANNKLNEIIERAKLAFQDDYSQLLPFYNYSLDVTAADSVQLDSVSYKASSGIVLHDLRNDWADNLYLLWGAAFYLQQKFDSAYLMFQFINYAFAPKEKDGYYKTIGSRRDGNSALSISTKEKNSLAKKIFSEPPSRNDAFIWQIRNYLAQDQFAEASSLIVTLKNDPAFPKRLKNDLHEVQALMFYKQNIWDSAAFHLEHALDNATNKQEKARWEYLAAQLYELAGQNREAEKLYGKVSSHTTDLVLDIYAKLASIRVNKDEGEKAIEKNVATLLKMAKRDKYTEYRDVIYYMAAQMELQAENTDAALALLLKSIQFNSNNVTRRNKVFLQLADLSFEKKKYRQAYNFYDSLNMNDTSIKNIPTVLLRKGAAGILATNIEIIQRQDSLQRIAALPDDERRDFVKKLVRQLRRQQGLKDEGILTTGSSFINPDYSNLFPTGKEKGEWYFYNLSSRTRGQQDFKSRWGNRPNVDNWRRSTTIINRTQVQNDNQPGVNTTGDNTAADAAGEITFDGLYNKLPLTNELLKISNDSIQAAFFAMGKAYIQQTEDCPSGTDALEQLRIRFPGFQPMDEVLFNLYYCYNKTGDIARAEGIKKLMNEKYSNSNLTTIVSTGKNPEAASANQEAAQTYEDIYDLFIEGKFEEAIAKKNAADSIYGKNYWKPQLLYIESVYYIKQREDSTATVVLNSIISQFPNTPLAEKAGNLVQVLSKRKQIEDELRNLNVTRREEDTFYTEPEPVIPSVAVVPKPDSIVRTQTKPITPVAVQPVPKDSLTNIPLTKTEVNTSFVFEPNSLHYVVLILNKVDPVFSNEAKNAFFRYNKTAFLNNTYTLDLLQLNADNRLLITAPFKNAADAVEYIKKVKPVTPTEIIPWLKGGKYYFTIISQPNLELLKKNTDLDIYQSFLHQHLPDNF